MITRQTPSQGQSRRYLFFASPQATIHLAIATSTKHPPGFGPRSRVGCVQVSSRAVSAALGRSGLSQIGQSGLVCRPARLAPERHPSQDPIPKGWSRSTPPAGSLRTGAAPLRTAALPLRVLGPVGALFVGALSVPAGGWRGWLRMMEKQTAGGMMGRETSQSGRLVIPVTGDCQAERRPPPSQWDGVAPEPPRRSVMHSAERPPRPSTPLPTFVPHVARARASTSVHFC